MACFRIVSYDNAHIIHNSHSLEMDANKFKLLEDRSHFWVGLKMSVAILVLRDVYETRIRRFGFGRGVLTSSDQVLV